MIAIELEMVGCGIHRDDPHNPAVCVISSIRLRIRVYNAPADTIVSVYTTDGSLPPPFRIALNQGFVAIPQVRLLAGAGYPDLAGLVAFAQSDADRPNHAEQFITCCAGPSLGGVSVLVLDDLQIEAIV